MRVNRAPRYPREEKEIDVNLKFATAVVLATVWGLLFSNTGLATSKETIYASYKYALGDSDTKSDAKKIAFIENSLGSGLQDCKLQCDLDLQTAEPVVAT